MVDSTIIKEDRINTSQEGAPISNSPQLKQLTYISHQVHDFSRDDLHTLMVQSRSKNKRLDVTGLLLFDKPIFLQVLEGPTESINQLMDDILADDRHTDVDIIYVNEHHPEREFGRWLMGCKILGQGLPEEFKALDDRVKGILRKSKPNGELARQLLLDFRNIKNSTIDI